MCLSSRLTHLLDKSDFLTFPVGVQPSATSLKQSVKDRLGPLMPPSSDPPQDSSGGSQVRADAPSSCLPVKILTGRRQAFYFSASQNSSKVSVKDRLGFSAKPAASVEKVNVCFCSGETEALFLNRANVANARFSSRRCSPPPRASPRPFTTPPL